MYWAIESIHRIDTSQNVGFKVFRSWSLKVSFFVDVGSGSVSTWMLFFMSVYIDNRVLHRLSYLNT